MDSRKVYAAKVLGLAGVYFVAAKLGLDLAFEAKSVTAIWAPTGIALAALVIWGYRVWPGVALGALLANTGTGVPLYSVLGITIGNTLEALVGAYLLRRFADFRPSLERVRDVLALVVFAAGISTTVSATIGVTSLLAGGEIAAHQLGSVWRTWWLGDMGGDLLVAPALMVAITHWPYRRAPGRPLEAVALVITVVAVGLFVFSRSVSLPYLIFPPLIWAAFRFWQPGATGASLMVAAIAVAFTQNDAGPWHGHSPDVRLLLAQTFVGATGITALVLAAVVTERKRAEEAVEEIAGTLQESLLPTRLPEIPGIESAVNFRPAGRGHLVGGDFYDVFENDDGSWAVIVGDVCGKGAAAAALTGLARHTLRLASVQEERPSRILGLLNDAILRQSPSDCCTVAYARLEPDGVAGTRLTVSVGGHPPPLLLRSGGAVEQVGRLGTLLGLIPDPELSDHAIALEPGDALLLYTDGLTESQAPERIVSIGELVPVLESCAGRGAAEMVERIEAAVLDPGARPPRDDVAVLVIRVPDRAGAASEGSLGDG